MSSEEIKTLRRKLKKFRESGKLQEISDCCCSLAAYLSDEEEHEEALKLYKESLTCCEKLGNKVGVALAHRMIAEECINLGYFEDALQHVTVFLNYAQDEGDKVEEQRGLVLKGHVYFTQAEYISDAKPNESKKVEQLLEQSMEAYRKSFAICNAELHDISERERLQMKARLLQNKSLVLSRQNKLDYAQAHLIRAIKICTKEKLNDTEHICYLSLGDLYLKKGEPEKALNVYDKALELSHSTQKKRDSLVGKAKTYIVMENYQQAKRTLKMAYKVRGDDEIKKLLKHVASVIRLEHNLCTISENELKVRKDLYKKLGNAYCGLKSYKKGIKCYLNMLGCAQKAELNKNDLINCYSLLCKAFINDKQYDKALFYSHQEVESLSKWAPEKAYNTYLRIAKLHELNGSEFEEIHFAYSKAKLKAQQFNNHKLQIKCLKHLINIGKSFNKPDLVRYSEKEFQELRKEDHDSSSSCASGNDSDTDKSTDSENSDQASDDIKDLISDSDVDNEEYDRPKERCKRTKFTIKRNEKGETDLHVAAIKGNYKRVKQLIDQGHPVNVRDTAGWTPLHEACNHGYVDIVSVLLDFGANINDKGGPSCDGTTPLHDAAINGQLEVINTLVKRGASTLVLNNAGETPLQCLLAWKKTTALDADEDALFQTIINALKSPLDSEDIKRHLKPNKNFFPKTLGECKRSKASNDIDLSKFDDKQLTPKPQPAVSEYKETIELLRGKRPLDHRDSRNHSEDSEDEDCLESLRKRPKSACREYREAIDLLRFKRKKSSSVSVKTNPKPALISEEEYVDNCILDNDEEEDMIQEFRSKRKKKSNVYDKAKLKPSSIIEEEHANNCTFYEKEGDEHEENIKKPYEEEVSSHLRKKVKSSTSTDKKPSLEEESKSKPWLKSIPLDLLEDSFELPAQQAEYVFKSVARKDSEVAALTQTPVKSSFDITVKLFNEQIKVTVGQLEIDKLSVNWLIQELMKKHSILQNPDHFIHLKTRDGILGENDSLSQVRNTEIECIITKWKVLPLSDRYEKMCRTTSHPDISSFDFKRTIHPQVVEMLKKTAKTRCLSLTNLKMSSLTLAPICKAIRYETFIQSLDLSWNYFGDKGMELIVKTLEKCIIEELDVSGCNISSAGVYHFSSALKEINELSKNGLEVLNLSNNPITDDAVEAINNIIKQLPNLRVLNIDRCELDTVVYVNESSSLVIVQGNKFESPNRAAGRDS